MVSLLLSNRWKILEIPGDEEAEEEETKSINAVEENHEEMKSTTTAIAIAIAIAIEEDLGVTKNVPGELIFKIFTKLHPIEILSTVPLVCHSWRNISKQPGIIRSLDLREYQGDHTNTNMLRFVRNFVDRSCGQLVKFTVGHFASDDILHYVVYNSNSLKSLLICSTSFISHEGLVSALKNVPFLEELELNSGYVSKENVEVIVKLCPQLKYFRMNGDWNDENKLNQGLEIILNGCRYLECLDLERCFDVCLNEDLLKKCGERLKCLRLPDNSTCGYEYYSIYHDEYYFFHGEHFEDDYYYNYYYDYYSEDDDYEAATFLPPKAATCYL